MFFRSVVRFLPFLSGVVVLDGICQLVSFGGDKSVLCGGESKEFFGAKGQGSSSFIFSFYLFVTSSEQAESFKSLL